MRKRLVASLSLSVLAATATAAAAAEWQRPVDEAVSDGWRPPVHAYASGNRGVDFATEPGSIVKASGAGTVSFAGQVGGTNYVVVEHGDGLRTTYGNLERIDVSVSAEVEPGQPLGAAAGEVHFGLRQGDRYLDPNLLFGAAYLVPDAGNRGSNEP